MCFLNLVIHVCLPSRRRESLDGILHLAHPALCLPQNLCQTHMSPHYYLGSWTAPKLGVLLLVLLLLLLLLRLVPLSPFELLNQKRVGSRLKVLACLLACLLPSLLMYETGLPHWGCLDHSFAHLVNVSMWNTWVKIVALRPILAYWVGVEHMISLLLLPSLEEGPKTYPPTLGEIEIELDKYPCVCSPRFAPKGQEVLLLLVVIIIIILVSSSTSSSSSVG